YAGAFSDRNTSGRERYLQHARACRDRGLAVRGRLSDGELCASRVDRADVRTGFGADRCGLFLGCRTGETITRRARSQSRLARQVLHYDRPPEYQAADVLRTTGTN